MIAETIVLLLVGWITYSGVCLTLNFRRARQMEVPLIIVPVSPMNVFWLAVEPLVFGMLDNMPFDFGTFTRYGRRGWHFKDKADSHMELGDVFASVTPVENFLHIADPSAILEIFSRKTDFVRPVQLYSGW